VTDSACSWSVRKTRTKNNENPIPSNDFKAIEDKPQFEQLAEYLADRLNHCNGAAVAVQWLISPEPERLVDPEKQAGDPFTVVSSEAYNAAPSKLIFLDEILHLDWETIQQIAEATKDQAQSPLWHWYHKGRLTASRFGEILSIYSREKAGRQKPSQSLLQSLYMPANLDKVLAVMWGREHESVAIAEFTKKYKTAVEKTGFWFDECGYLGGSPDGLIGEKGICEVKCPYSLRNHHLKDVLKPDHNFLLYTEDEGVSWKYNMDHKYYHQIQGQMHFTRRDYCVFLVWTPKSLVVKRINADPLWPAICLPMLKNFYVNEFVPYVKRQQSRSS